LSQPKVRTTQLRLSSGDGPITRTVLETPLRDATPSELPIIDTSKMYSSSFCERLEVAKQIRDACTNNGFFYIKNHGVAPEVLQASHEACLQFFRQDADIKQRANSSQSKNFNGYKPPQTQRINPFESIDVRESFSWKYDPVYDESVTDVSTIPPDVARFLTSEEFPWEATANLPKFKSSVIAHWQACMRLARVLVRSFALSLDLAEDFFDVKFSYPDATFT
jgi:isopenicillin N synthase-like dioxygenase